MSSATLLVISNSFILLFSILIILLCWKGKFKDFGFNIPKNLHSAEIIPLALSYGIISTSLALLFAPGSGGNPLAADLSWPELIILVWIYASICEEILFRGVVQTTIAKRIKKAFNIKNINISIAVLICTALFAMDHITAMLMLKADKIIIFIIFNFAFITGITAGYYREKTDSIIPAIIIHALANVGSIIPILLLSLLR